MTGGLKREWTRRELLQASLIAGSTLLAATGRTRCLELFRDGARDSFQEGKKLATLEFVEEGRVPLDTVSGKGLDGRLFTDLSAMAPESRVAPTEKFYIRTRASELLDDRKPWLIRLGGLVQRPLDLTSEDLESLVKPAGLHLMECAGNARDARFGMLSVAEWAGAPLSAVLDIVTIDPRATRVLISGFDLYPAGSATSVPGASWIFPLEELKSSGAFLATKMNGRPLTKDHGAPVRLVVPGWYGCTCIKWVNEITLVDDSIAATSQMREFATRTFQPDRATLAKDYLPAVIDQAAMPIRVEKWHVGGRIRYRVVGIVWGGSRPVNVLEIRFNPEESYVPVDAFKPTANDPWSFWTHAWDPKKAGTYRIHLRVKDPPVRARRLNSGHYVRSVQITDVGE